MADGYARATGGIGVAMATSARATNMVTGIATAMLDSSPVVCITGQVSSKVLGSDAFQEVDITGITMPITKYNVVVSRAEDIARTLREAFIIAQSGRPGPCSWTSPRTRNRLPPNSIGTRALRSCRSAHPHNHKQDEFDRAVELLNTAKRPVILAGRGIMLSGPCASFEEFVRTSNIPVAMTLLGIGCFPASDPMNLGMMGMHGEAWVNTAIQEATCSSPWACASTIALPAICALMRANARKIHIEVDRAEITKTYRWTLRWWATPARL